MKNSAGSAGCRRDEWATSADGHLTQGTTAGPARLAETTTNQYTAVIAGFGASDTEIRREHPGLEPRRW